MPRASSLRETPPVSPPPFERLHLLWFDEPCRLSNLSAAYRIASENVTPVGFGRFAVEAGVFQNLLRSDAIDVVRPDVALHGITQSRRIAAVAEPYYVAAAPFHNGGPIATAAALHLAASLPNFFIQQVPFLPDEQDRRMRARLAGERYGNRQGWISATAARAGIGNHRERSGA